MSETEPKQGRRRAWVWWAGGLTALLGLGVVLQPILLPRPSPVTWEAYERIGAGMTVSEVERVLGGPPGRYRTRPAGMPAGPPVLVRWNEPDGGMRGSTWLGDEAKLMVEFDSKGVAVGKWFLPLSPRPTGNLDLMYFRLGMLKDRWFPPSP